MGKNRELGVGSWGLGFVFSQISFPNPKSHIPYPISRFLSPPRRGFTLIVVLAGALVLAILAGVALRHPESLLKMQAEQQYEQALQELSLANFRYLWLNGREPRSLDELSNAQPRVIRRIPVDPLTGKRESWVMIHEAGHVRFGTPSSLQALDGSRYMDWWIDEFGILHRLKENGEEPK